MTSTSARSMSDSATARPSSCRTFSAMLRLPRLSSSNGGLIGTSMPAAVLNRPRIGSPVGGSILITSAPQSAMMPAAAGPATQKPSSTTRMPASGPVMPRLYTDRRWRCSGDLQVAMRAKLAVGPPRTSRKERGDPPGRHGDLKVAATVVESPATIMRFAIRRDQAFALCKSMGTVVADIRTLVAE